MRTALSGAFVGNFMEWYDFRDLRLSRHHDEGSLPQGIRRGTSDAGPPRLRGLFLVRPLGGIILGPIGDRIGRQRVLYFTMAIMASATALIGLLPTSDQMESWLGEGKGMLVIIPLYLLKMLQGFSTGGEFAGASTYVAEFSPTSSAAGRRC